MACKGLPYKQGQELVRLARELGLGWQVVEVGVRISDLGSRISGGGAAAELVEAPGHPPCIFLAWGKVKLTVWTHKINGLTESDFVLAAKADRLMV